jgi:hypothetical protein
VVSAGVSDLDAPAPYNLPLAVERRTACPAPAPPRVRPVRDVVPVIELMTQQLPSASPGWPKTQYLQPLVALHAAQHAASSATVEGSPARSPPVMSVFSCEAQVSLVDPPMGAERVTSLPLGSRRTSSDPDETVSWPISDLMPFCSNGGSNSGG